MNSHSDTWRSSFCRFTPTDSESFIADGDALMSGKGVECNSGIRVYKGDEACVACALSIRAN